LRLVTPQRVADTLVVLSTPTVVVPLPSVIAGRIDVSEIFQVTSSVTSWVPVTPLKVATASKVTVWPLVTVALVPPLIVTTKVSTTGHTVTEMLELVTVPSDAVTVVVPGGFGILVRGAATN